MLIIPFIVIIIVYLCKIHVIKLIKSNKKCIIKSNYSK